MTYLFATLLAAISLAIVAGCGDDGQSGASIKAGVVSGGAASGGTTRAVVSVDENKELGEILVTAGGGTLYAFEKDRPGKSACYGACASVWRPYVSSARPKAKGRADAASLGTARRSDGGRQVTYRGHPLYTYLGDKSAGDVSGNDFEQYGAEWYAATPEGETPED